MFWVIILNFKEIFQMKKCFLIFIGILSSNLWGQGFNWYQVFGDHTFGGFASIHPTAAKDEANSVFVTVSERDTLKIVKINEMGMVEGELNTNTRFDYFTPITKLSNGQFAISFRSTEGNPKLKYLIFDSNLSNQSLENLDTSQFSTLPNVSHLIPIQDKIYISLADGNFHKLLEINEDFSLEMKFTGSVNMGYGAEHFILDNGNVVFSYKYGNSFRVNCVNPITGELVWSHQTDLEEWKLRNYRIFQKQNEVLKITHDINWVGSNAIGTIKMIRLNAETGEELSVMELLDSEVCSYDLFDMVYKESTDALFMVYLSNCEEEYFTLKEFDISTGEIVHTNSFTYVYDELNFESPAYLSLLENDELLFIYKSRVDDVQFGNLFITKLNEDLSLQNTFEFVIDNPSSSEYVSHILPIRDGEFLLTGAIPDPNIFIFVEQVHYFTAWFDMDLDMSLNDPNEFSSEFLLYPNPAKRITQFDLPEKGIGWLHLFDSSGRKIHSQFRNFHEKNSLNVAQFPSGMYRVKILVNQKTYQSKLIIL